MTRSSNPPIADTVNPAGDPNVRITKPAAAFTRADFMRDLKKVATKHPPKK